MKACGYCKAYTKKPLEGKFAEYTVNSATNTLDVEYQAYSVDSSFREKLPIRYCPMCGRDLHQ